MIVTKRDGDGRADILLRAGDDLTAGGRAGNGGKLHLLVDARYNSVPLQRVARRRNVGAAPAVGARNQLRIAVRFDGEHAPVRVPLANEGLQLLLERWMLRYCSLLSGSAQVDKKKGQDHNNKQADQDAYGPPMGATFSHIHSPFFILYSLLLYLI